MVSGITPTAGAVGLFVPFPTIHDDTLCAIKQQAVFFVHEASESGVPRGNTSCKH